MIAQKRGDEEPKTRRRGKYEKAAFRKNRKKGREGKREARRV